MVEPALVGSVGQGGGEYGAISRQAAILITNSDKISPMFQSFQIKNFRCFDDLKLDSLNRVNLIAGGNNVGKTALLEAIFLHLGGHNPELSIRLNAYRGFEPVLSPDPIETWGWLFPYRDTAKPIELTSTDMAGTERRLTVELAVSEKSQLPLPERKNGGTTTPLIPLSTGLEQRELRLSFKDGSEFPLHSSATISEKGLEMQAAKMPFPLSFFLGTRSRPQSDDIARFSELDRVHRQDELLEILAIVEPRLTRLAIDSSHHGTTLRADVGGPTDIPLAFIGEGLGRLLSISLAILLAKDGVVLIDEIENGLHHSVLTRIWRAISEAAKKANVQIFATTHSRECIEAAGTAFGNTLAYSYDLRLLRLERDKGAIRVVNYDRETLETSMYMNLEVR